LIRQFTHIVAMAAARKGGLSMLKDALASTPALPPPMIAAMADARILAEMRRWIFYAGFSARVVDAKWPGFEQAFRRFDLWTNATMGDRQINALSSNSRIVRNVAKIRAIRTNARLLREFADSNGSAPASSRNGRMTIMPVCCISSKRGEAIWVVMRPCASCARSASPRSS
jgi:hypothetical protein